MKKILGIVLVGAMLVSGCGAGAQKTKKKAVESEETLQSQAGLEVNVEADEEAKEENNQEDIVDTTLKEVFAEHGLKVGTCVSSSELNKRSFKETVLNQFNSLTVENAMKPDSALSQAKSKEAGKVVVDFNKEVLTILEFARENGFSMRGHTLVWYSQTPEWLFHEGFENSGDFVDRDEMLKRMEDLISGTFAKLEELGYIDLFYAYDVVNEAWMEDGTMRENHWLDIIGDDYAGNIAYKYAGGLYKYSVKDWLNDHFILIINCSIALVILIILAFIWRVKAQKKANAALRNSSECQKLLIENIAGSLKMPINEIYDVSQMASNESDDEKIIKKSIKKIVSASKDALWTINEIIDSNLLDKKQLVLKQEKVNIRSLVKELEESMQPKAEAKNITLTVLEKDIINKDVIADKNRLMQILECILTNAITYTANGGKVTFSGTISELKKSTTTTAISFTNRMKLKKLTSWNSTITNWVKALKS